jgi:biotin transport system substrate-specific component
MNAAPPLKMIVLTSLFVSLIIVGAFIAIPIGPVPIVLQNMVVLLAGIILGPRWGLACVVIYLLIGFAGIPVFAGGTAGVGKLFGPTGGYLMAYVPCVFVTGWISTLLKHHIISDMLAMVVGSMLIYAIGVPFLAKATGMEFSRALVVGCYPFLLPDLVKIVAAAFIARAVRPLTSA